eukprot:TRINITY_DN8276_c0_g1_i1.p1 TRINITY_DN8276_c0_g1~~TRINITY_DN8276_c0_g1_i1.p1  ORF type:complete len:594 (-),score=139.47 TRINITY_DN8276_c0_g1_i1:106-1887(-)
MDDNNTCSLPSFKFDVSLLDDDTKIEEILKPPTIPSTVPSTRPNMFKPSALTSSNQTSDDINTTKVSLQSVTDTMAMENGINKLEALPKEHEDQTPYQQLQIRVASNLEDGWIMMRHDNGLNFFYHKPTGVISWTKPYKIENGLPLNVHNAPGNAFRTLCNNGNTQVFNILKRIINNPELKAEVTEKLQNESDFNEPIPDSELRDYMIVIISDILHKERLFLKEQKKVNRANAVISATGKTPITFLQEYITQHFTTTPEYKQRVQDNPEKPFVTEVYVLGELKGAAADTSKKKSKQAAALAALQRICPKLYPIDNYSDQMDKINERETARKKDNTKLKISDPDIILADGTDKTPAQVVQEYCTRSLISMQTKVFEKDLSDEDFTIDTRFKMKISIPGYSAYGEGKSKKEAKQRACQNLLIKKHPNIKYWIEVLEYYELEKEKHTRKAPNLGIIGQIQEAMIECYGDEKDEWSNRTFDTFNRLYHSSPTSDYFLADYYHYSQRDTYGPLSSTETMDTVVDTNTTNINYNNPGVTVMKTPENDNMDIVLNRSYNTNEYSNKGANISSGVGITFTKRKFPGTEPDIKKRKIEQDCI